MDSLNRPVSFGLHIVRLFTPEQIDCMSSIIQLDSHSEVAANAHAILARLEDGSMPQDETRPWPQEWVALFQRWIAEGTAE